MKTKLFFVFFLLPTLLFANTNINQETPAPKANIEEFQKLNQKINDTRERLTNFHQSLENLNTQNNEILFETHKQQQQIKELNKKLESSNFTKEFIYPVILSIVAAFIFWLVFSFFPEKSRHRRVRNKLDLNIHQLYQKIFSILDLIMRHSSTSPSNYQNKIRAGKLTRIDIELGLQNKCINVSHSPHDISGLLLPIGNTLNHSIKEADKIIERIFSFSTYLSSDEIILLEEIRTQLYFYDLELLGSMKYTSVNPSLSYMAENIEKLSNLYSKIQKTVFNNSFENRDLFLNKVQFYFDSKNYDMCIKQIEASGSEYLKDKILLEFYSFISIYMKGNHDLAYKTLNRLLITKPHLVSYRNFLKNIITDKTIKQTLERYYSSEEINELYSIIRNETSNEQEFIESARRLQDYYTKKASVPL